MGSSRRALQTKGKLFTNFKFVFELLVENRKIFQRIARCELIKVQCYISMDSSRQAVQTNGKLFLLFRNHFSY